MSWGDMEEMAYDAGYYDGLMIAWQHMFNGVLAEEKDFMDVLKALAALRDKARSDRDRHEQDEDNCICVNDENNPHCQECY